MLDPRLGRILAALVPRRTARDAFEPAWEDLRFGYLTRRARAESASGRGTLAVAYLVLAALLVLDCWRLAAVNVVRRDRRAVSPSYTILTEPKQTERLAMFLYLVRHAFRQLVREPAFTVAALLTLALGVGANVAVFAVVEAVLLRPLPYANADDLVILNHRDQRTGITKEFIAIGDYVDLVASQTAFETISAYGRGQTSIVDGDKLVRLNLLGAGPGFLEILRVRPVLGRTFRPEDSRQGAPPVMMLGYEMWQDQFGGDPSVIGRTLRFEQTQRQVVGITPAGFTFPPTATTDMLVPLTLPTVAPANRRAGWALAIGRLKSGRTLEDAATNLTVLSRQMEREFPQSNLSSEYFAVD